MRVERVKPLRHNNYSYLSSLIMSLDILKALKIHIAKRLRVFRIPNNLKRKPIYTRIIYIDNKRNTRLLSFNFRYILI